MDMRGSLDFSPLISRWPTCDDTEMQKSKIKDVLINGHEGLFGLLAIDLQVAHL